MTIEAVRVMKIVFENSLNQKNSMSLIFIYKVSIFINLVFLLHVDEKQKNTRIKTVTFADKKESSNFS